MSEWMAAFPSKQQAGSWLMFGEYRYEQDHSTQYLSHGFHLHNSIYNIAIISLGLEDTHWHHGPPS